MGLEIKTGAIKQILKTRHFNILAQNDPVKGVANNNSCINIFTIRFKVKINEQNTGTTAN